jgi:hypothetical protein
VSEKEREENVRERSGKANGENAKSDTKAKEKSIFIEKL